MVRNLRNVPIPVPLLPSASSAQLAVPNSPDRDDLDDEEDDASEYVPLDGDDTSSVAIGLDSPPANQSAVPGRSPLTALAPDVALHCT